MKPFILFLQRFFKGLLRFYQRYCPWFWLIMTLVIFPLGVYHTWKNNFFGPILLLYSLMAWGFTLITAFAKSQEPESNSHERAT